MEAQQNGTMGALPPQAQSQPGLTHFAPVPIMQEQQQPRGQQLNNLYKTALCKHFSQHKHCVKGNGCHFAHGDLELRRKDEQLPIEVQYKMLNIPYNNYKTQVCKYFEQEKQCHFGKNCTYAHGREELRKPYEELPLEVGTNMEISNPNAFRLLKAQVQALQPRFVLNESDLLVKNQILEISNLFREQRDDQGMQILKTLLQNNKISAQYAVDPSNENQPQPVEQPVQNQQKFQNATQSPIPIITQQSSLCQEANSQLSQPQQPLNAFPQGLPQQQVTQIGPNLGLNGQAGFSAVQPSAQAPALQVRQENIPVFVPVTVNGISSQNSQMNQGTVNGHQQIMVNTVNGSQIFMVPEGAVRQAQTPPQATQHQFQSWNPAAQALVQQLPQYQQLQQQQDRGVTTRLAGSGSNQSETAPVFSGKLQNQMLVTAVQAGAHQNTFGQGFLYTAIPGEASAADNAQWSMRQ